MASKSKRRSLVLVPASPFAGDAPAEPIEADVPADPSMVEASDAVRLRVMSNYAFYTDDGAFKAWPEGAIVTDPDEIQLLTERAAPVERVPT